MKPFPHFFAGKFFSGHSGIGSIYNIKNMLRNLQDELILTNI